MKRGKSQTLLKIQEEKKSEMPNIENSASFHIDTNGKHYFVLVIGNLNDIKFISRSPDTAW